MYPMEMTYAGAILEELQPKGKSHAGAINGELNPVVGTCARLGEECEKEGVFQRKYSEVSNSSTPHLCFTVQWDWKQKH